MEKQLTYLESSHDAEHDGIHFFYLKVVYLRNGPINTEVK